VKLTVDLYLVLWLRMTGGIHLVLCGITTSRGKILLFDFRERMLPAVSATGVLELKQHEVFGTVVIWDSWAKTLTAQTCGLDDDENNDELYHINNNISGSSK
jgi:hypothetical protein